MTDKEFQELKELTNQIRKSNQTMQWFDYGWDDCAEIITRYVEKKNAESAEQARKEAAEKAVAFVKILTSEQRDLWGDWEDEHLQLAIVGGCDVCLMRLKCYKTENAAILGNSAPVSTDSEKLAIAVKALEDIREMRCGDSWKVAHEALKEIHG